MVTLYCGHHVLWSPCTVVTLYCGHSVLWSLCTVVTLYYTQCVMSGPRQSVRSIINLYQIPTLAPNAEEIIMENISINLLTNHDSLLESSSSEYSAELKQLVWSPLTVDINSIEMLTF